MNEVASLAPAGPALAHEGSAQTEREAGSFRDRNGSVYYRDGRVFRTMSERAFANWRRLETLPFFQRAVEAGRIVRTRTAEDEGELGAAGVVEHARIPFVSYPYEWTFGMLQEATLLHLELMREALAADFILKDASPYNVQWEGVNPVFIDVPSFEPLGPGEPWVGYRQFCELMLYPLMLQAYKGIDHRPWLRGRIDGIPADDMIRLMSARDLARPGVLLHVAAQSALQRRYGGSGKGVRRSLAQAGFGKELIQRNVEKLDKLVRGLKPARTATEWSDYERTHSYDATDFEAKADFVRRAAATRHWKLAWDLGCNTGTFSRIAELHSDYVVAMDADWMAIEHFYRREQVGGRSARILPLAVHLADASPAQGWRGLERKDLAARGRPELTLCLALVHHVVITSNIPLASFLDWLAGLGTSLVIEFVGREDEMVQALLANREDQYPEYHLDSFRSLLAERFAITAEQPLKGGKRVIFSALAKEPAWK